MRDHGVLNRILLIYDEAVARLGAGQDVPPEVIQKPATLARKFVEDYHERLEGNFIFPRFEKRGRWSNSSRSCGNNTIRVAG